MDKLHGAHPALIINFIITKERVIGLYEIDENFYPGENSAWQKQHFSFEITEDDYFQNKEPPTNVGIWCMLFGAAFQTPESMSAKILSTLPLGFSLLNRAKKPYLS